METLISLRSGGSLRMSVEPEQVGGDAEDFQGAPPLFPFSLPNHVQIRRNGLSSTHRSFQCQSRIRQTSARPPKPTVRPHPMSSTSGSSREPVSSIRVGSRKLSFPTLVEYARYIDFFFEDINPCYSCVNEADFRARSERLFADSSVDPGETCFLALNYIIFACSDVLLDVAPAGRRSRLPGWQWFLASDELMAKRKVSGRGDLSLIQFLLYEVGCFISHHISTTLISSSHFT